MLQRKSSPKSRCNRTEPWTLEEYMRFSEAIHDNAELHCACQVLFWCGLRIGELQALTRENVDLDKGILHIVNTNANTQPDEDNRLNKTESRFVHMPDGVTEELSRFVGSLENLRDEDCIFTFSLSDLRKVMSTGAKKAEVDKVSTHSLRSSHIKLLMKYGVAGSMKEIAERLGTAVLLLPDEDVPDVQCNDSLIAVRLNQIMKGGN